ncbi:hypothetical protein [Komagataeibacter oboediens]|uniref:hypothetical protein n=1 Tax=Komagataeibacter oboediens TaxID=65958 RepID=UPI0019A69EF9|nr:hypothetical protein MSKU3_2572 [Komagataeibacter oboediens]
MGDHAGWQTDGMGQETMFESKIIEVDGVFVGAAIITGIASSLRFYATHDSVRSMHNAILPDLVALKQRVTATFRRMGHKAIAFREA